MVATRAPSLRLREKAIAGLLNSSRRDGLWDGPWAGRIAQEVMTMGETGLRRTTVTNFEYESGLWPVGVGESFHSAIRC